MTINHKFRASFTVLSTWYSGNWQMAINYYFELEQFLTPAMVMGRQYHEEWQKYIDENERLPLVFGHKELKNPITENKIVVDMDNWLELVGKYDCYDDGVIYEFKTGKQSSEKYASSPQVGIYGLLAKSAGSRVEKAEIYHYDQYRKKSDMSIIWMTEQRLKEAENWVVTLSSEIHDYFTKNNLYVRLGGQNAN